MESNEGDTGTLLYSVFPINTQKIRPEPTKLSFWIILSQKGAEIFFVLFGISTFYIYMQAFSVDVAKFHLRRTFGSVYIMGKKKMLGAGVGLL